jgi:hypothetical protein
MKVRTRLHSGGLLQDAQDQAVQVFDSTNQFLQNAGEQTSRALKNAVNKSIKVWNCLNSA